MALDANELAYVISALIVSASVRVIRSNQFHFDPVSLLPVFLPDPHLYQSSATLHCAMVDTYINYNYMFLGSHSFVSFA